MNNKTNEYHFITLWKVKGSAEEVYKILDDVDNLPNWWPAVYLDIKVHQPGDQKGVGKIVELYTKGWLPYTLRWKFRSTKREFPNCLALEAIGDFKGQGEWTSEEKAILSTTVSISSGLKLVFLGKSSNG